MTAFFKPRRCVAALCAGILMLPLASARSQTNLTPWSFSVLAGDTANEANGTGTNASFNAPHGIALDASNNIYVGDYFGGTVRKITPGGVATTVASGLGTDNPVGVCLDSSNNIYVVCAAAGKIDKITETGTVSTFVSGLDSPNDIVMDVSNNMFLTEFAGDAVYEITPAGVATLVAGSQGKAGSADGTNATALFNKPWGVAVDASENLYISDSTNCTIRKITANGTNWVVTTIAGQAGKPGYIDGFGTNALFDAPAGISVDAGGELFVCDRVNQCVRKLAPWGTNWLVTTVGNVISAPVESTFVGPRGIVVDGEDNLYLADPQTETIQKAVPVLTIYTFSPDFGFSAGQFGFDFGGPPGESAAIDATTDMFSWMPIVTNIINTVSNHFTDSQSGALPNRVYRLRVP